MALLGLSIQRADIERGIAPRFYVRATAYSYGNVAAYETSGS